MSKKKKSTQAESVQRTWFGMPMNWDWKNWNKNYWNPKDEEIFPPKRVGIGWDINFHALFRQMGLIRK